MVAWAGGGGGPHFFLALTDHPEWGHGHTVFGGVLAEDMAGTVQRIMQLPTVVEPPKRANMPQVMKLATPIPFRLERGPGVAGTGLSPPG